MSIYDVCYGTPIPSVVDELKIICCLHINLYGHPSFGFRQTNECLSVKF
jgi:hypothetical protein